MTFRAGWLERRRQTWRRRFALIPVRIHDQYVWLGWYWYRGDICACERARTDIEKASPYVLVSY